MKLVAGGADTGQALALFVIPVNPQKMADQHQKIEDLERAQRARQIFIDQPTGDSDLEQGLEQHHGGHAEPRPEAGLGKQLRARLPGGLIRAFFTSGGSDSEETALRLARQYHKIRGEAGRVKYLSLKKGYHGTHTGAASVNGNANFGFMYEPLLPGCSHIPAPYPYRNPFDEPDPARLAQLCLAARGAELFAGLQALGERHAVIGDVRGGHGLMCALELVADRATKAPIDKASIARIHQATYDAGVMIRVSGSNIILSPPLVLTAEDVQTILEALEHGFQAI